MLHASAARSDITPPIGVRLVGYLDREAPAERVNDGLTATAVAFRDPRGDALVIVCCDTLGIPPALGAAVRQRIGDACGISPAATWLAPSHTHSGPPTFPGANGTPAEHAWVAQLSEALVAVATEAWATLQPAHVRVATCETPTGLNRRALGEDGRVVEMAGAHDRPVDNRVLALRIEDAGGTPIATLVNVACHPVASGRETLYVSADYPGALRTALEEASAGLCAFTLGAAGDVNPRGGIQADPLHARALGRQIAQDVLVALEHASIEPEATLRVAHSGVLVRYPSAEAVQAPHLEHLTWAFGLTRSELDDMLEQRFPWEPPVDETGVLEVEVAVAQLGDVRITALPYEVFAATGGALLQLLGQQGATISLANASLGYLPPTDELARGGYEVDESFLLYRLPGPPGASAEPDVVGAVGRLVDELREGERP